MYKFKGYYIRHLNEKHDNVLKQMPKSDIAPNWNDPDNYCRSCDYKYSRKLIFHRHLQSFHQMSFGESLLQTNSDNYCQPCDVRFVSKGNYRRHLKILHQRQSLHINAVIDHAM